MVRKPSTTKKTDSKVNRVKRNELIEDTPKIETPKNPLQEIKIEVKHKNDNQKKLTTAIKNSDITICSGPAGTGKTYLACQQSLLELKNNPLIKKIVLIKSVTTLKSEEIGFLKGSMEEKMEPFMYSFVGNIEKIIGRNLYSILKDNKFIETQPIAYLRGVNIDNAIIIIDETQNISIENIRTIMTRLGENSRMIFLGDIKQIDAKLKDDNALTFLVKHFKNITNLSIIEFTEDDIVRHPLIKEIEKVFNKVLNPKVKTESEKEVKPFKIDPHPIKKPSFLFKIKKLFHFK